MDGDAQRLLYDSMKTSVIDISSMDDSGILEMKKFIYKHAKTGDVLRVNVTLDDENANTSSRTFVTEAVFVQEGSHLSELNSNVFLPFGGIPVSESPITISSSKFEFVDDQVRVDDRVVNFGSSFFVGGRRVVLAEGSVVVLVEDTVARVFPEEGVEEEIVSNQGTLAVGDITATGFFQIENSGNPETSIVSYVFHHDASTDHRTCVYKRTHVLNSSQTSGSSLIELGYSNYGLEKVLEYDSSRVDIRSVSKEGLESSATINVDGISFSSDESAVIFGTESEFRLKYDQASDTLQIQHLNDEKQYITKREFGR